MASDPAGALFSRLLPGGWFVLALGAVGAALVVGFGLPWVRRADDMPALLWRLGVVGALALLVLALSLLGALFSGD